jgi:hypothetical protein
MKYAKLSASRCVPLTSCDRRGEFPLVKLPNEKALVLLACMDGRFCRSFGRNPTIYANDLQRW